MTVGTEKMVLLEQTCIVHYSWLIEQCCKNIVIMAGEQHCRWQRCSCWPVQPCSSAGQYNLVHACQLNSTLFIMLASSTLFMISASSTLFISWPVYNLVHACQLNLVHNSGQFNLCSCSVSTQPCSCWPVQPCSSLVITVLFYACICRRWKRSVWPRGDISQ